MRMKLTPTFWHSSSPEVISLLDQHAVSTSGVLLDLNPKLNLIGVSRDSSFTT